MFPENVRLIGICGRAKSGKSHLAKFIKSKYRNVNIVSLATPLKNALIAIFAYAGYTAKEIDERLHGKLKEYQDPILGYTPRFLMQTLGTEWGRNILGNSWWINLCETKIKRLAEEKSDRDIIVVVDDIRFENEIEWLKMNKGKLVTLISSREVRGELPPEVARHISESLPLKTMVSNSDLVFVDYSSMPPSKIEKALTENANAVNLPLSMRASISPSGDD